MVKLVIFDYDGVINDSFSTVYDIYKVISKELGFVIPDTINRFKKTYGYDFHECYKNLGLSIDKIDKASVIFRREIISRESNIFAGIQETLALLKEKYILALVTSNFSEGVLEKLKENSLEKYFSSIIGQDVDKVEIDKSNIFESLMRQYNISNTECVVIGDRTIDYDAAIKSGIENVILVEYGWGYDKSKCQNTRFDINEPFQLVSAIETFNNIT